MALFWPFGGELLLMPAQEGVTVKMTHLLPKIDFVLLDANFHLSTFLMDLDVDF